MTAEAVRNDAYWLPFTANRDFLKKPRVIKGAEGHHYIREDGERFTTPSPGCGHQASATATRRSSQQCSKPGRRHSTTA